MTFDTANNGADCADTNATRFGLGMDDGVGIEKNTISNANVGNYKYSMNDKEWTKVDNQNFDFKTRFGACRSGVNSGADCSDCLLDAQEGLSLPTGSVKIGCTISSNPTGTDVTYDELHFPVAPRRFATKGNTFIFPDESNDTNYIYMNTLSVSTIDMAIDYNASIIAQNEQNETTSNFSEGCMEKEVGFDLNKTISFEGNIMTDKDIKSRTDVSFQSINAGGILSTATSENNFSTAVTVEARVFNEGEGAVGASYNYSRALNRPINPIDVDFTESFVKGININIAVNGRTDIQPEGASRVDRNVSFYYGCLSHQDFETKEYVAAFPERVITVDMRADYFCDDSAECTTKGALIGSKSKASSSNFYHNKAHVPAYGNIVAITDEKNNVGVAIVPANTADLYTTSNATNEDDNITTQMKYTLDATTQRPYETIISLNPDEWLQCDDHRFTPNNDASLFVADSETYQLIFEGPPGGWIGTGNTGSVVETNASFNGGSRRVDW